MLTCTPQPGAPPTAGGAWATRAAVHHHRRRRRARLLRSWRSRPHGGRDVACTRVGAIMLWWVVWPAPVVPLYGVLPWKSCGLTPQPCRHLGTYRHLSPPVDTSCRWGPWRRSPQHAWPAAQAMMLRPMVGVHRAGWRVGTEHAL